MATTRLPSLPGGVSEQGEEKLKVIPILFGRARCKSIVLHSTTHNANSPSSGWRTQYNFADNPCNGGGDGDAVIAICQAPATLRGIWWGKEYVGLRWNGTAWVSSSIFSGDAWKALYWLQAFHDTTGYWDFTNAGATGSPTWHAGAVYAAPHEMILNTVSPFGKRYAGPGVVYQDITGSYPAWSHLDGTPNAGQGFYGLAHLRAERLAYGEDATHLRSTEWLMDGVGSNPSNPKDLTYSGQDCRPDTAIRWMLVKKLHVPDSSVITDVGPDGRYESSFEAYCTAMTDLRCNGLVDGTPKEALDSLAAFSNCEIVQSEGKVKIWALGDAVVGSYQPSQYVSGAWTPFVIDRMETKGWIRTSVVEDSEIHNSQPVRYNDRAKDFKENTLSYTESFHAEVHGKRPADAVSCQWISTAKAALLYGQFLVRQSINQRVRVTARVSRRWAKLEPGDLIQISDGIYADGAWSNVIGIPPLNVRLSRVERLDDGGFEIEGWEWAYGATHPIDLTPEQPATPVELAPAPTSGAGLLVGMNASVVASIPSGSNILPNGDFALWDDSNSRPSGWLGAGALTPVGAGLNHSTGAYSLLGNLNRYNTLGLNSPYFYQGASVGDPSAFWDWRSERIPVVPGKRYAASAYTGAHRAKVAVFIYWCTDAVEAGAAYDYEHGENDAERAGGPALADWKRCYTVGVAPEGWCPIDGVETVGGVCPNHGAVTPNRCVGARLAVRKYDTKPGQSDSYAFMCRAQFEEIKDASTGPGPWSPTAANGTAVKAGVDAAAAKAAADAANAELANIASDGILSPVEKPAVIRDYSVITAEQAGIDAQADAAGVSRVAYDNAVSALTNHLLSLTSPYWWSDTAGNTTIVGATFRSKFADAYTAKQALLDAITAAIRGTASGAGALALTAQQKAQAASDGVADLVAGDVVVGRIETLGYAEDASGNPTVGMKAAANGTTLKVAAGSLQLGKKNLSQMPQVLSAGEIGCTGSGGSVVLLAAGSAGLASLSRVDRGSGNTPRYAVQIAFNNRIEMGGATFHPMPATYDIGGTITLPVLLSFNRTTNTIWIGLITPGGTWVDPTAVAFRFSFLLVNSFFAESWWNNV